MSQPTTRDTVLAMNVARETCKLEGLNGILHILDAAISKLEALADAEERQRPEQPEAMGSPIDLGNGFSFYKKPAAEWNVVTRSEFEALVRRVEAIESNL